MIYLLRHTRPNIDSGICYGQSDIDLHPDFQEIHLKEVLERVDTIEFNKIYSSPLKRCNILAEKVAERREIKNITVDNRLKELNFGDWELKHWDKDIFIDERSREWFENYITTPTPNGESFMQLVKRAKSFLFELKTCAIKTNHLNTKQAETETTDSSNILVVTHSGFIRAALYITGEITIKEIFDCEIDYGNIVGIP